jgi:site-specific DNA recombinase
MIEQAAIYARVSSEQQAQARTIQSQVSLLEERVAADGYLLPKELQFIDEGYSGATLVRPALERLRDSIAAGAIQRVYVHSPDRLARKYAYQIVLVDEFQRAGVEIVFLNRELGKTPEDDLLLQVQGMVAARNGSVSALGGAPYGYRYISKHEGNGAARYEIVLTEARIVQQIFDWFGRERVTLSEVCRRLAAAGIKTKGGKTFWHRPTICQMLNNTAYMGSAAFGKTRKGEIHPRLALRRGRIDQPRHPYCQHDVPEAEWILVPVPPLVSKELFEAVQEQLKENRERARERKRGATHLLQGVITCRKCNYGYYGKRTNKKKVGAKAESVIYYRCTGTDGWRFGGKPVCENRQVRAELIEEAVWSEVRNILEDPKRLEAEYRRRLKPAKRAGAYNSAQLEKQKNKLRNGIARMIDGYADGLIEKEEFEPRIKSAKNQLAKLEQQLKQLIDEESAVKQLQLIIVKLEDFTVKLKKGLNKVDWQTKRDIIRTLVRRVEVDGRQVNVIFRVGPSPFELGPQGGPNSHHCNSHEPGNYQTQPLLTVLARPKKSPERLSGLGLPAFPTTPIKHNA